MVRICARTTRQFTNKCARKCDQEERDNNDKNIYEYIQEITKKTHSRNPNAYELSKYTQNIRKKRTHKCIELFSPLSPINFQY